ncbi:hypothetical protein L6R52_14870 [Myxococcota bacterium]|nr:hypothetical protein [Myxococcota bacterium]
MSRFAGQLALVGLVATACAEPSLTIVAAPADGVEWLATVWLDATGAGLGSTGLVRWSPDAPLRGDFDTTSADIARVVLVGYSSDALRAAGVAPTDALTDARILVAPPTDPLIPTPTWSAAGAVHDGLVEAAATSMIPELTAAWLPRCPTLIPPGVEARVDVGWADLFCATTLEQKGCSLEGDEGLAGCGLPFTRATIDGRGRGTSDRCALVAPREGSVAAISCDDGTRGDVYLPDQPDPFVFEEVSILDVPFTPTNSIVRAPIAGFVTGAAITGDEVAIVSHDGRVVGLPCVSPEPTSIHFFDLEFLLPAGRVPAPACLTSIVETPDRSGFFGLFGTSTFHVGRFDASGALVATATVAGPTTATHYAVDLVVTEDGRRVVAAFAQSSAMISGRLAVFDAATLAPERVVELGENVFALHATEGSEVVVGANPDETLHWVDAATGGTTVTFSVASNRPVPNTPQFLTHLPGDPRVFVACPSQNETRSTAGAVHLASADAGWIAAVVPWDRETAPSAMAPWPLDDAHILATLVSRDGTWDTTIAVVDPVDLRVLPGQTKIGRGPVSVIRTDARDRLYLVLPWSAKLVRVTPE